MQGISHEYIKMFDKEIKIVYKMVYAVRYGMLNSASIFLISVVTIACLTARFRIVNPTF